MSMLPVDHSHRKETPRPGAPTGLVSWFESASLNQTQSAFRRMCERPCSRPLVGVNKQQHKRRAQKAFPVMVPRYVDLDFLVAPALRQHLSLPNDLYSSRSNFRGVSLSPNVGRPNNDAATKCRGQRFRVSVCTAIWTMKVKLLRRISLSENLSRPTTDADVEVTVIGHQRAQQKTLRYGREPTHAFVVWLVLGTLRKTTR